MTKYIGTSGTDTFAGADNIADEFDFAVTDLSNADTVNGGTGATIDFLKFTTAGTVAAAAFANVSHIEQLVLANGTNDISLTDALVGSSDSSHILTVSGGSGDDTINASAVTTAANRVVFRSAAGNDTLTGGAGNDVFYFAPTDLTSGDAVNGGAGTDNLVFTAAGTISATALSHVSAIEAVVLANGTNNVALTDTMAGSATSHILTVNGGTGDDTIDASAVTTAANRIVFRSGAGNDTLTGGAGSDAFQFLPSDLTSGDTVTGGAGADSLVFTAAGTIAAAALTHVSGIEVVTLANGTNSLALTDAMVGSATGRVVIVNGGTGNDTIDASAVTTASNRVIFKSDVGSDTLTGGAGNDIIYFAPTTLDSTDTVDGGAGADNLVLSAAGTVAASALAQVSGIEFVVLANGSNSLALADALVGSANAHILTVTGGAGNDTVDAGAVTTTTNRVIFNPGAGTDTLTGGSGNDVFQFSPANLDSTDTLAGGAGSDSLVLTAAGTVAPSAFAHVSGIEIVTLANGTNGITLTDALVTSALNHILTVNGGTGNDTINASALTVSNRVIFNSGAGNDVLTGGNGNDVFNFTSTDLAGDTVAGGAGFDRLSFTAAGTITASALAHVSSIEQIVLANGTNSFVLTNGIVDSVAIAGHDAPDLVVRGGSGADTIDATQVTTTTKHMELYGEDGEDTFLVTVDGLNRGDSYWAIEGSDPNAPDSSFDTLRFTTAGTITADQFAGVVGIDQIDLADGTNDLTLSYLQVYDASINTRPMSQLHVVGSSGVDTIHAPDLHPIPSGAIMFFQGNGGADHYIRTGVDGSNVLVYADVSDSTGDAGGTAYDRIEGFSANANSLSLRDQFDLPAGALNTALAIAHVDSGTLSSASFDTDMAAAIGSSLGAHQALLFHTTAGTLANHDFLVVNPDGTAGYTSGADYVIDITGYSGTITTANFI